MKQQQIKQPKFKNTKKYLSIFDISVSIVFKILLFVFLIIGIALLPQSSIDATMWIPTSFGFTISILNLAVYIMSMVFDIVYYVKKNEIKPKFITLLKTIAITASIVNMFFYFINASINNVQLFTTVVDSFLFILTPFIMIFDYLICEYKNKLEWIDGLYGLLVSFLLMILTFSAYLTGYRYDTNQTILAVISTLIPVGIMFAIITINNQLYKTFITNKSNVKFYNSILIKSLLIISGLVGIIIQYSVPTNATGTAHWWTPLMYFTIQSNIWIIITVFCFMIIEIVEFTQKRVIINSAARSLKLVFTVSINLTGVVFTIMLAPASGGLKGFVYLPNVLLHIIVPVVASFDFLWFDFKTEHKYKDIPYALIPPVFYAIFSVICFYNNILFLDKPYPYFFFNFGSPAGWFGFCNELPYMGSFYWILLIAGIVDGAATLYTWIMKKKYQKYIIR